MIVDCRASLFTYTDPQVALDAINEDAALSQLKRLKKSRSPGIDGFTIEHLTSLMLGSYYIDYHYNYNNGQSSGPI